MVKYVCDWCAKECAKNNITIVELKNVYHDPDVPHVYHICRDCGRSHMPESAQPMLSWTSDD